MKALLIVLTILFIAPKAISAQVKGCYNYLTFQEFQRFYTSGDLEYLKGVYKAIKYPPTSRENEEEGVIRVQLINHAKDSMEIIASGSIYQHLLDETIEKLAQVNSEFILNNETKFITEFYVEYDLEPFDSVNKCHEEKSCNYIVIVAYRVPPISRN